MESCFFSSGGGGRVVVVGEGSGVRGAGDGRASFSNVDYNLSVFPLASALWEGLCVLFQQIVLVSTFHH